jgi:dTDP-4-dehydrorhamnose reductase
VQTRSSFDKLRTSGLMRIAVVGARGQLAAAFVQECAAHHDLVTFTRSDLDVTDDLAVHAAIAQAHPDIIVNGAAYNDVDGAEDHPIDALNLNAFAVRALARAARTVDAALVHFGTDFVFDGETAQPYTETDRPNPRSVYAASKLLGEWFAADVPRAYILRVESLFGRVAGIESKGSAANILATLLAGGSPKVFEDRIISPTYIPDAARAVRHLVESGAPAGLYHCVNSGSCTWLEFGREVARQLGMEPRLTPVRMREMVMRAARPMYCALSNDKLRAAGVAMPSWQDAVARFVAAAKPSGEKRSVPFYRDGL